MVIKSLNDPNAQNSWLIKADTLCTFLKTHEPLYFVYHFVTHLLAPVDQFRIKLKSVQI